MIINFNCVQRGMLHRGWIRRDEDGLFVKLESPRAGRKTFVVTAVRGSKNYRQDLRAAIRRAVIE